MKTISDVENQNEKNEISSENTTLMSTDKNIQTTKTYRKYGKIKVFHEHNGEPVIVIGPHWPFFVGLFIINLGILILLFSFLWEKLNTFIVFIGLILAIIQLGSFLVTTFSNPGLPKSEYQNFNKGENTRNFRICKDCNLLLDTEKANYHCHECQVCIEGFDHHCPWTSKCIGEKNLYAFYSFVGFTMIMFAYLIFSVSLITPSYS